MAFNNPQPNYYIPQPQPGLDPAYAQPSYPHPSPSYSPHPATYNQLHAPGADGQAQRFHHASHQQYQVPNQAHGHGPTGSMPPPDSPFHRQTFYHQPSPAPSGPLTGPVSTFPAPSPSPTRPQSQPPPQNPQVFRSPPSTSQKTQPPMTAATAKPVPPSNSLISPPPVDPAKSAPMSTAPSSLEPQRVSTLLELNRIILQEVVRDVAAQNAQKGAPNPTQSQQNPQPPTPSSTTDTSITANAQSISDATTSTKQEADTTTTTEESKPIPSTQPPTQQQPPPQNQNQNQKLPHTKEYVEYMRRLQANLAYLASVADRNHKPGNAVPQFPAIMEAPILPPPHANDKEAEKRVDDGDARESITELYGKLRGLWPGYKRQGSTMTMGVASGPAPPVTTSVA